MKVADRRTRGLVAELTLVSLVVGYGSFSVYRLVFLLLFASQSLWIRGLGWSDVGLSRPINPWRTLLQGVAGAFVVLIAVRFVIAPLSSWVTGARIDLSSLDRSGDFPNFGALIAQAWTLAAFAEEMVFRGYLMHRVADLFAGSRTGWITALVTSSALFGLAHRYQGWAGVVATGMIGILVGLLFLHTRRNLWAVILCHAVVDTAALSALYLGRASWLYP